MLVFLYTGHQLFCITHSGKEKMQKCTCQECIKHLRHGKQCELQERLLFDVAADINVKGLLLVKVINNNHLY